MWYEQTQKPNLKYEFRSDSIYVSVELKTFVTVAL